MDVFFQLVDRSSGNVIKDYVSEEDALEELGGIAREYGCDEIRDLALPRFQDGRPTLVARDDELVILVLAGDATLPSRSRR